MLWQQNCNKFKIFIIYWNRIEFSKRGTGILPDDDDLLR